MPGDVEKLKSILRSLIFHFDRHEEPFDGLSYYSPLEYLNKNWSDKIGVSLEELLEAISCNRACLVTKTETPEECVRIFNSLNEVFQTWKDETGARIPPYHYTKSKKIFPKKKIAKICTDYLQHAGVRDLDWGHDSYEVFVLGKFDCSAGYETRVRVNTSIKYDGELSFGFQFPLYKHDEEPTILQSHKLLGESFFRNLGTEYPLGINPPDQIFHIFSDDLEGFDRLENFLKMVAAIKNYLCE